MLESEALLTHIVLAEKRTTFLPLVSPSFGLSAIGLCPSVHNLSFSQLSDPASIFEEDTQWQTLTMPRESEEA